MSRRYFFKTWGLATEDHFQLFSITKVQSHFYNKAIKKLSADKTKKLSMSPFYNKAIKKLSADKKSYQKKIINNL